MGDQVNSYNQSGGITAHTVHVAETPPSVNLDVLGENVPEGDKFVTSFALTVAGRPSVLGMAVRGEDVEEVSIRQDGPSSALFNVVQGTTTLGFHYFQCGNPVPGRYIAEARMSKPAKKLDIQPFADPIRSCRGRP